MHSRNKKPGEQRSALYADIKNFALAENLHKLSRNDFPDSALKTVEALEKHGYQALIVGGAIRDLLCGIKPKDFDIATDATPEQVKSIFRNSRIIGRRFRIVHLYFGRDVLEVATFRGNNSRDNGSTTKTSAAGQLVRDNQFGSIEEDANRRDFSANALYYSPTSGNIYDFTNSFDDIRNKRLRILGNPEERFVEDPVRMLRAYRFSSKLNFHLDDQCQQLIQKNKKLLLQVSNARMFDESFKLFHNLHSEQLVNELRQNGLFEILFPSFEKNREFYPQAEELLSLALKNTEKRISVNKPVTIAYIYAVILWPAFISRYSIGGEKHNFPLLESKAFSVMREQSSITAIPKRHAYAIKDIWEFQIRLENRKARKIEWILSQKRFRAAFDFLQLREACGELDGNISGWWEEIQFATPERQQEMIRALKPEGGRNYRRPRKRKKRS